MPLGSTKVEARDERWNAGVVAFRKLMLYF